jgi:hypothetical protein
VDPATEGAEFEPVAWWIFLSAWISSYFLAKAVQDVLAVFWTNPTFGDVSLFLIWRYSRDIGRRERSLAA